MVGITKYYLLAFTFLSIIDPALICQVNTSVDKYRIEYLTTDEGLSQNTIDCILKDSRGFMWFGTWNGLNRFDGYSFKIYKKEKDRNSISNNFIHTMCEDNQGNIWIGTRNGLNLFKFSVDQFLHFPLDSTGLNGPSDNWINTVYCDGNGTIWVGTKSFGLDRVTYNTVSKTYLFENYRHNDSTDNSISNDAIQSIFEDSKGRLWVGTSNGLNILNRETDEFTSFYHDLSDPSSLSNYEIRSIYEDRMGNIWLGTQFGLNRWVEGTSSFIRYLHNTDNQNSISHDVITQVSEDMEGNLYICTLGGLNIFDRSNSVFIHFPIMSKQNYSLNNEFINTVFCDETGMVWIGTEKGGVNKFNIYQKQFNYYSSSKEDAIRLNHSTINAIRDEDNYLWIGTAGGGLNLLNKKNKQVRYFTNDPHNNQSLSSNFVSAICLDSKNNAWIGTWGGGFNKPINLEGRGKFLRYQNEAGEPSSLINNFVSSIYMDFEQNLWIGTEGGLELFIPDENKFIHIANSPGFDKTISEVGCILRSSSGNLWIGTRNGLFLIPSAAVSQIKEYPDPQNIQILLNDPADTNSISEDFIISLMEDSRGNIWIGTYGNGLNKLVWNEDLHSNPKFLHYTTEEGLSNNVIYGMLEDDKGILWLSTDYGLSKFDPMNETFRNYYSTDGLESNQFYWSAFDKGVDGQLYFGGINGVNYFFPDQIKDNTIKPKPVLTNFMIFNKVVNTGIWNGERSILKKVISETTEIELNYTENTFSFEFSALSYNLSTKNTYKYKMIGVDEDWITVTSDRRYANYTKLEGGEYYFLVSAANNDGLWNDEPYSLKITIKPPFWKTLWFRFLLIIFIISSLFGLYILRIRQLNYQKVRLKQQVAERTREVEDKNRMLIKRTEELHATNLSLKERQQKILEQAEELQAQTEELNFTNQKLQDANATKDQFFSIIAHDLKNPFSSIMGFSELLMNRYNAFTEIKKKRLIRLINESTNNVYKLLENLLQWSRSQTGRLNYSPADFDLSEVVQNTVSLFHNQIKEKQLKIKNYLPDKIIVFADRNMINTIIRNLISNAIKFTENGEIEIRMRKQKNFLNLYISDTGIGIPKEKLKTIFEVDRSKSTEGTKGETGTGLGLILCKEFAEKNGAKISCSSKIDNGSTFTLSIPIRKL